MKIRKNTWDIQDIHVISWLLKDVFWCLRFTWLATAMIIPTSFLTIYILIKEKENRDSNITLTCWVFMNVFWMLHELHDTSFRIVQLFMFLGIFNTFRLINKRTNESNIS
jgi:hypothetical protein